MPAGVEGGAGIQCSAVSVNVANDAVLVHDERYAASQAKFAECAVTLCNLSRRVAEQREGSADFLREGGVRRLTVDAQSENLSLRFFKFGEAILVRLEFAGSPRRIGHREEGENDILPAAEIGQPHAAAVVRGQFEIRRGVAGFWQWHGTTISCRDSLRWKRCTRPKD